MEKITIISLSVCAAYILYIIVKYFIGRRRDKKATQKLREELEENKWRRINAQKSVGSSLPAPPDKQ